MVLDELLDVPLVARLRPAALVVAAGRVVVLLDDLFEPPGAEPVEVASFAADEGDEHAVVAADERHERREVELEVDQGKIGHAIAEGERVPRAVDAVAEDREPARALAAELVLEEGPEPVEIGAHAFFLLARDIRLVRRLPAADPVEERIDARVDRFGGR